MNRGYSRALGWRAGVSGRQILECQVRTGGFAAPVSARQFPFRHARDRQRFGHNATEEYQEPVRVYSLEVGRPTKVGPTKSTAPAAWLRTTPPRWAAVLLAALVAIGIAAWQFVRRESGSVSLEV